MSVLIKGMQMPEGCDECELYYGMYSHGCSIASNGIRNRYNYDASKRPDWCPLVALPEKHGRLIDADKLMREEIRPFHYHLPNGDEAIPIVDILHAQTVVEAEGEE